MNNENSNNDVIVLLRRCVQFAFYTQTFVQSLQYLQTMPLPDNTRSDNNNTTSYHNMISANTTNLQSSVSSDRTTLHEFAVAVSHLITLCNKYNLLIECNGMLFSQN